MRRKTQRQRRVLVYDSGGSSRSLPNRCAGMKAFYSCVIHTNRDDGYSESIDIIPKNRLTLEEMIEVVRRQFLDGLKDDDETRIHFKLYSQDSRPK